MAYSERERPSHYGVYRDAAYLSYCSGGDARDWLKSRPVEFSAVFGVPATPPNSHLLEYILYRRRSRLIDLSLSEHGRSQSVLRRVYKRANAATRVVACANPSLFMGDSAARIRVFDQEEPLIWQIVRRGPLSELRAICENPHLTSGFYEALVGTWEGDSESKIAPQNRLSDERFIHVLHFLSTNPRVSTPREDSEERHYLDGFADYEYNSLFTKCWRLAEIVPVELEWAHALERLYRNLHSPFNVFDDVDAILNRWRLVGEKEFSPFVSIRERIAAQFVKPTLETMNSDDPAIRRAFYSSFDPESHEFRNLDWNQWLDRDDLCSIDLEQNMKIWRSALGRSKLRALLWHKSRENHDITDVGFFDQREEEYAKSNPEWFKDEEELKNDIIDNEHTEQDRFGALEQSIIELATAFRQRQGADAIWFLAAALVGSFIGAAVW